MVWGVKSPNQNTSYLRNKPFVTVKKAKQNDDNFIYFSNDFVYEICIGWERNK